MQHANDNHAGIRVLDLFSAAAGGWSLGMHRAGYRTIAACEVIDWRRALYSQNNPGVPVYDDVTTLTADRLVRDGVGLPDIIVGSPPCQDISSANTKGKGVDGERSILYFEAVRLIDECRPRWFALENSSNLRTRGADRVIDALAAIGYTCWPFVVSAGDVGANHERKRSWLVGFNARTASDTRFPVTARWHTNGRRIRGQEADEGIWSVSVLQQQAAVDADASEAERRPHLVEGGNRDREAGERTEGADRYTEHSSIRVGDLTDADEAGQEAGLQEYSLQSTQEPDNGCRDGRSNDRSGVGQVGGCESIGQTVTEPWADWNSGLAHHLRVDDGLSGWVAQSRIAIGGPRGTVAASLIVEAFGDAVCPQIPEAIGRAILRVERALADVANDNQETPIANAA
ncbi:DNA methyltransferase [Agrobacterium rosae]|uniref:DNA (cytosine-5-)-methyltransferase n=1 Tax=Agrobacterium rosae TaxID=1972867 RepID=A0AAE5S297_9HYPH|nr:DNA cytosine methyltransferase [Agrobacterium rosae]POO54490.1 DNA methyltransferase [Agrobacterium rosae]